MSQCSVQHAGVLEERISEYKSDCCHTIRQHSEQNYNTNSTLHEMWTMQTYSQECKWKFSGRQWPNWFWSVKAGSNTRATVGPEVKGENEIHKRFYPHWKSYLSPKAERWQRTIKSNTTWQHSECHFFLFFRSIRVLQNCTVVSQCSCEFHPSLSALSITYRDILLIQKVVFQHSPGFHHAVVLCERSESKGWSLPRSAHGGAISAWNT